MTQRELSVLESSILGLLRQTPRSGYDLMKRFAETAMGSFSDSPGEIHPAVRRLARRRFVAGVTRSPTSLRPHRGFRPTPAGIAAFDRMLQQPVVRDDVVHGAGRVLLRFALARELDQHEVAIRLIEQFGDAIEAYVPELRAQIARSLPPRQATSRRS